MNLLTAWIKLLTFQYTHHNEFIFVLLFWAVWIGSFFMARYTMNVYP